MTLLAETSEYLVEYERYAGGMITIARYSDGHALAFTGKRVSGEFRDCLRTHSPETVIQTYIRMAKGMKIEWSPFYSPSKMALVRNALKDEEQRQ